MGPMTPRLYCASKEGGGKFRQTSEGPTALGGVNDVLEGGVELGAGRGKEMGGDWRGRRGTGGGRGGRRGGAGGRSLPLWKGKRRGGGSTRLRMGGRGVTTQYPTLKAKGGKAGGKPDFFYGGSCAIVILWLQRGSGGGKVNGDHKRGFRRQEKRS